MGKPIKKTWGCKQHCNVWWYRDGVMFIGCGHCPSVSTKIVHPVGTDELLTLQAERSRAGHQVICGRPIR